MKRNFIQTSEAWYSKGCLKDKNLVDEFNISVHDDNDEHIGEFSVAFMHIGNQISVSAQIQCFDDGARALEACSDIPGMLAVLHELSSSRSIHPHQFASQLLANGYNNVTPVYAADTMGKDIVQSIKDHILKQIKLLQINTNWHEIPGNLMSIGLFVKDNKSFVAAINSGAPDSEVDIIGATIYGSSSISSRDEEHDCIETLDMLLMDDEKFFEACSPNAFAEG